MTKTPAPNRRGAKASADAGVGQEELSRRLAGVRLAGDVEPKSDAKPKSDARPRAARVTRSSRK